MQENDNLVQLQDENGKDVNFEHLMTIEHEGNYYVVLEATEDTDDCKEGEAIILKIVRDEESDEDVYAIVGAEESDPYENKISNESPVGAGLLGAKRGDVVSIEIPAGILRYEILDITR